MSITSGCFGLVGLTPTCQWDYCFPLSLSPIYHSSLVSPHLLSVATAVAGHKPVAASTGGSSGSEHAAGPHIRLNGLRMPVGSHLCLGTSTTPQPLLLPLPLPQQLDGGGRKRELWRWAEVAAFVSRCWALLPLYSIISSVTATVHHCLS